MDSPLGIRTAVTAAIEFLFSDRSVTGVLRERLQLVVDRLELAEQTASDLARQLGDARQETSRLRHELEQCEQDLARYRTTPEFHQHRGALWRRAGNGWEPVVYCPKCRTSTTAWPNDFEVFNCGRCNWSSSFRGHELQAVMAGLPHG